MGLNRSEGGADKAARLPKGWTGPVSTLGTGVAERLPRLFFCAGRNVHLTNESAPEPNREPLRPATDKVMAISETIVPAPVPRVQDWDAEIPAEPPQILV